VTGEEKKMEAVVSEGDMGGGDNKCQEEGGKCGWIHREQGIRGNIQFKKRRWSV